MPAPSPNKLSPDKLSPDKLLLTELELDDALPDAPFSEHHTRVIDRPIDEVWPECLAVTAQQIKTLGPLMALRSLPSRFGSSRTVTASAPAPLLDVFVDQGFVLLRKDEAPTDGRAVVLFGAVSRFWSVAHNAPLPFESPEALLSFDQPNYGKTVCQMQAVDLGDGTTRIETTTLVTGTDEASIKKFRPYWMIIRGPSGLIRRSWLAAIERRMPIQTKQA